MLLEGQFLQALAPSRGRSQGLWAAVTRQTREADAEERSCLECPASHTLHPSLPLPFLLPSTPPSVSHSEKQLSGR